MTPIEIETFPETWCRMWSEDATLAHRLLADGGRQWSGKRPGLDPVVGPGQAEAFIRRYQRDVGNRFEPRTLVLDDAGAVAYTWDVTLRDGSVLTGADVNVLRDGKVVENWTIPMTRRDERDDLAGTGNASRDELAALARGEAALRGVGVHREVVVDVRRQTAAYLWTEAAGKSGGIDVLVVRDGAVAQTWSVPAVRPFTY